MVTGHRGYIGSVLVPILLEKNYDVVGYDAGYYADNKLEDINESYKSITKDIRDVSLKDLEGIEGIIHLAGLSNDPLGEFLPELTFDINYQGTLNLVKLAKQAGVSRFVYASSQSMYGLSDLSDELDEDLSEKNPLTAYAKAKWDAEKEISTMSTTDFVVTSLRPST
ncbi:MAG: NAD(P)-dependent oxidoreductase, partial [Gammaproteobacteria bacterium]|nr:NAD(P)-dependent oxidoreductase [Gammaproteobacteria bacterium]